MGDLNMTREEQIIEASQLYAKHQQKPFIDGALWADAYPTDEVLKLRKMFESAPDAYKQGYKDAIEKACEWLINHNDYICGSTNGIGRAKCYTTRTESIASTDGTSDCMQ